MARKLSAVPARISQDECIDSQILDVIRRLQDDQAVIRQSVADIRRQIRRLQQRKNIVQLSPLRKPIARSIEPREVAHRAVG